MQQINPQKAARINLEPKSHTAGVKVTGMELDALAEYMLANPQGDRKQHDYFAAFQAQVSASLLPLCITITKLH